MEASLRSMVRLVQDERHLEVDDAEMQRLEADIALVPTRGLESMTVPLTRPAPC